MDVFFTNVYIFVMAMILAMLEIQIEGKYGWAHNLPTWRPKKKNLVIRAYQKIMGGREVTGYHLLMFTFVFLIFNFPYFYGLEFNFQNYLQTFSLFLIFIILWDFLWFVLNPYHPLKKFRQEHIWWHKKWLGRAPVDYYLGLLISLLILCPITLINNNSDILFWWLKNIALFGFQLVVVIIFTLHIMKIDNWHKGE